MTALPSRAAWRRQWPARTLRWAGTGESMRTIAAVVSVLCACHALPEPSDSPPLLSATCERDAANTLRARCQVTVEPPGPVQIRFAPVEGGPERTHVSEAVSRTHDVPLFLLRPRTEYAWTATRGETEAHGTFTTGGLPPLARVVLETLSGTPGFPHLLTASPCQNSSMVVILDTDGTVLWYEDLSEDPPPHRIEVVNWTEDDTLLVLVLGRSIVELDLTGARLRVMDQDPHGPTFHHDVWRRGGLTWALDHDEHLNEDGVRFLSDGIQVFDADGARLARWDLLDMAQPGALPSRPLVDWSHANSVWSDDHGDLYVSFRHFSAVVKLGGDPGVDLGQIRWVLAGDDASPLASDFTLTSEAGHDPTFQQQHNAHLLPDGRLALFDNRLRPEPSRVLHVALDEARGTADVVNAWTLDEHCDFHGSAWHTPAGNPLANCGPAGTIYEFQEGRTEPVWKARLSCAGRRAFSVARVTPLALPDEAAP